MVEVGRLSSKDGTSVGFQGDYKSYYLQQHLCPHQTLYEKGSESAPRISFLHVAGHLSFNPIDKFRPEVLYISWLI